jgi:hypothetical protein
VIAVHRRAVANQGPCPSFSCTFEVDPHRLAARDALTSLHPAVGTNCELPAHAWVWLLFRSNHGQLTVPADTFYVVHCALGNAAFEIAGGGTAGTVWISNGQSLVVSAGVAITPTLNGLEPFVCIVTAYANP